TTVLHGRKATRWAAGAGPPAASGRARSASGGVMRRIVLSGVAFSIAALAAAGLLLTPRPAAAQFVCDSEDAGEDGAGATATGASSVACGDNANAVFGSTSIGSSAGVGADAAN